MDIIAKTILEQITGMDPLILSILKAKIVSDLSETEQYEGGIVIKISSGKADLVRIVLTWADEYEVDFFKENKVVNTYHYAHFPDLPIILRWAIEE